MTGAGSPRSKVRAEQDDGVRGTSLRAERTRAKLLRGARKIFERDGFVEARVTDIARAAGVAHGTFYTYFSSKEEIFKELVATLQEDLAHQRPDDSGTAQEDDPVARIDRGNRAYLDGYRRNAALMATLEQVATFNDELRELRRQTRRLFVERAARAISRWQVEGVADAELDAYVAASALCNMVDRFAYVWLVLGEEFDDDVAARTLTRLWCQALGMAAQDPRTGGDRATTDRRPAARSRLSARRRSRT